MTSANHEPAGPPDEPALTWVVVGLAVGLALVLRDLSPDTWSAATAPHASAGSLLSAAALALGWLVAARLLLAAAGGLIGLLPGALGRAGRSVSHRCTPLLLRRVVQASLGATLVAGPLAGTGAAWADPGPALPGLDRVAAVGDTGVPDLGATGAGLEPVAPLPRVADVGPGPRVAHPPQVARTMPPVAAVVVQPGDSLWRIAAEHLPPAHSDADVARAWPRWYAANRSVIGPDASELVPGEELTVPVDPR